MVHKITEKVWDFRYCPDLLKGKCKSENCPSNEPPKEVTVELGVRYIKNEQKTSGEEIVQEKE